MNIVTLLNYELFKYAPCRRLNNFIYFNATVPIEFQAINSAIKIVWYGNTVKILPLKKK